MIKNPQTFYGFLSNAFLLLEEKLISEEGTVEIIFTKDIYGDDFEEVAEFVIDILKGKKCDISPINHRRNDGTLEKVTITIYE